MRNQFWVLSFGSAAEPPVWISFLMNYSKPKTLWSKGWSLRLLSWHSWHYFYVMNRLWYFPDPMQLEGALAVSRQLDIVPGLASVLASIGLVEEGKARQFLFPRLRDLRDPFEIGGIQKAVDRIFQAV